MIITPLVSVLLTAFITFTVIGPVMRVIGDSMTNGVLWLFFDLGPLGGAIYGVVYPLLVITGMHHSMAASEMQILANIAKLGGSPTICSCISFQCCTRCCRSSLFLLYEKE